jgi:hypothetical protein
MTRRHIAILWHQRDRDRDLRRYAITHLADHWSDDGHVVRSIFGTDSLLAADLVIVHVDLSVVPAHYLEFAAHYPCAVNGRVQDIRRTSYSRLLLRPNDRYTGPVIVKSNANHAGAPEHARSRLDVAELGWRVRRRLASLRRPAADAPPVFTTPLDYRSLDGMADVPASWWTRPELVIERFLPERDGDAYAVRNYQFLGDRWTCTRMLAPHPIVNGYTQTAVEDVDPHPEIERIRREMGFDYGKFDYVVHDGEALLLDANKTTGAAGLPVTPGLQARRRIRAEGIYSFFAAAELVP